jgi:tetratricopeptide (TPR) repeat protein
MFPLLVIPIYLFAVWLAAVPKEKIVVFVCFLFMAVIPQLAEMESKLLRPLDPSDRVNVLAKAQLRGHESALVAKLESYARRDQSDFETMFSLGLLKHRGGLFDEAMSTFTVASDLKPRSAAVRNNLGNTYFVLGEYDKALEEYELAARLEPDAAAPHYNLAQTFSEKLMFSESSDELSEALRLDFARVNRFRRAAARNQPVEVMDMIISPSRLWEIVLRSRPRTRESPLLSGLFGVDARLLSYVSSGLLFLAIVMGIAIRRTSLGTECIICGAQSCYRCLENEICPRCTKKVVVTESAGMKERLEQKLRARAIKYRKIKALALTVVSPGAGHVFIGSTWKGVGFSLLFTLLLIATFLRGLLMRMSPFVQTEAGLTYIAVAGGLILVLYLFCIRSVFRTLGLEEA